MCVLVCILLHAISACTYTLYIACILLIHSVEYVLYSDLYIYIYINIFLTYIHMYKKHTYIKHIYINHIHKIIYTYV